MTTPEGRNDLTGEGTVTLLAGGDTAPVVQPVDRLAELIAPTFATGDFVLLQCERTYSKRGSWPDWQTIPTGHWSRLDPSFATVFKAAHANVVSVASNHALDWGWEALEDTIALFRKWDIQVVGGGKDEDEARKPAILEKDGIRIAVLAYTSVLRDGQMALGSHPGLAAVRARTWYVPIDFQPGCPPLIESEALEQDLAAMEHDIRAAKTIAHAVVVVMHWGLRYIPKTLAQYQTPVAHRAIDAGADVIVGHHPHSIKAVEVYNGKVCFYSIGNCMTTGDRSSGKRSHAEWNLFWYDRDLDSEYAFPAHCREIVLPKIRISKKGLESVSMYPAFINQLAQPRALSNGEELFQQVIDKLEWVSAEVPHRFEVEGDEIRVDI